MFVLCAVVAAVALVCLLGCGRDDERRTDGGSSGKRSPSSTPADHAPVPGKLRYLALGDSYTKGEGVPERERWPDQLARQLRTAGLDVADPQIIAETGWRTDDLNAGIDAVDPKGPFDLVSLLIGVNNQYQGRPVEAYRSEFEPLLRRAIALAGGDPSRVIVLSIPDYGATPYGRTNDPELIAAGVAQFNAVNRELSSKAGVRYVDVTPVSRAAATDPDMTIHDDLHPSGKMYATWVELALPEAAAALRSSGGSTGTETPVER